MATVTPRFKAARTVSERPGMSKAYLAAIRRLPSCVSGRSPCDAHHLRLIEERGVGMKATDRWALPLTRAEHYGVHSVGSQLEVAWFSARNCNCYFLAAALWDAWNEEGYDEMCRRFEAITGFPA